MVGDDIALEIYCTPTLSSEQLWLRQMRNIKKLLETRKITLLRAISSIDIQYNPDSPLINRGFGREKD